MSRGLFTPGCRAVGSPEAEPESHFFDVLYTGDADVVFATGRSASGDYSRARHSVVLGDNPWCDPQHRQRDLTAPARALHSGLRSQSLEQATSFTLEWPWPEPRSLELPRVEAALAIDSIDLQVDIANSEGREG